MNPKSRVHLENQKQTAVTALAARVARLREDNFDDRAIERNATVRQLRAAIRQAMARLARITAIETENVARVQAKADRSAAKKKAREKGSAEKAPEEAAAKKPRKKKKPKLAPTPKTSAAAPEAPAPAPDASTAESEDPAADPEVKE